MRCLMLLLLVLISCFGTGCFTMVTNSFDTHGYPRLPYRDRRVTLLMDLVTLPAQVPVWLDIWFAEAWADSLCWVGRYRNDYEDYVAKLEQDFNVALENPEYFRRFDQNGKVNPQYAALMEFFQRYRGDHVYKLTKIQAEYVARKVLEQPELLNELRGIWESKQIDVELRLQALALMRRKGDDVESHYKELLDADCVAMTNLQTMVEAGTADYGAYAALEVLEKRWEAERRVQKELQRQQEEAAGKIRQQVCSAMDRFRNRDRKSTVEFEISSMELSGMRKEMSQTLRSRSYDCIYLPENVMKVVKYELAHIKDELDEDDCLLPALENNWLKFNMLLEVRPQVLSVALRLKDRKAARRLVRAFCGNVGQGLMEPVVAYYEPRLAWLREEVLLNECRELSPECKEVMRRELDAVHAEFSSRRNCAEELKKVDVILRRHQPKSIPAVWFVALTREGDLRRLDRLSGFLGKVPNENRVMENREFRYE